MFIGSICPALFFLGLGTNVLCKYGNEQEPARTDLGGFGKPYVSCWEAAGSGMLVGKVVAL